MATGNPPTPQGKLWPDLVLVRDVGPPGKIPTTQFRVQVEVPLTPKNAVYMKQWLYGTTQDLTKAKQCVMDSLRQGVSQATKDIIGLAFATPQGIVEGKVWPDKVLVRDRGKSAEFRVQCEIDINDPEMATSLETKLFGSTSKDLHDALGLAEQCIPPNADQTFKDIVARGFTGQRGYEPSKKGYKPSKKH